MAEPTHVEKSPFSQPPKQHAGISNLNAEQERASTHPSNVLQILAPPGSGKTLTLTARLQHLLTHPSLQLPPHSIVLCTFTIKSAHEIRDRVARFLGSDVADKLIVGTFHSVARRLLGRFGVINGVVRKGFGIADREDGIAIVKRIVKRGGYSLDPGEGRAWISKRKSGKSVLEGGGGKEKMKAEEVEFYNLYQEYESELAIENLLDYDDLLLRCVDLLAQHPQSANFIKAVLVDEFQDTNAVQYQMMKLLAQSSGRVTVVGDPDQSIYGFRAAEVENVNRMRRDLEDVVVVRLVKNYRSSGRIVDLAVCVIGDQKQGGMMEKREDKGEGGITGSADLGDAGQLIDTSGKRVILPTHCQGTLPLVRQFRSPTVEASFISTEIRRLTTLSAGLLSLSDIAVLVRSSSQARLLEMALGRDGIPYRLVGGHRFFDKLEIRLLVDYMRVIWEPEYVEGVVRVVNVPARGVGDSFKGASTVQVLGVIREFLPKMDGEGDVLSSCSGSGESTPTALFGVFSKSKSSASAKAKPKAKKGTGGKTKVAEISLSSRAMIGVREFVEIISRGRDILSTGGSPADVLGFVIDTIKLEEYLASFDPEGYETRWANVCELVKLAGEMTGPEGGDHRAQPSLVHVHHEDENVLVDDELPMAKFLSHIALSSAVDDQNANKKGKGKTDKKSPPVATVTISTLHAAKGLEWPVVFILGAFEGSIPHSRSEDVDEERRLLYVGVTRGKGMVYVTWGSAGGKGREGEGEGEEGEKKAQTQGSRFGGMPSRFLKPLIEERKALKRLAKRQKQGKVATPREEAGIVPSSTTTTTDTLPEIDFNFLRSLSRILDRSCPSEMSISISKSEHSHQFEDHCDLSDFGADSDAPQGLSERGGGDDDDGERCADGDGLKRSDRRAQRNEKEREKRRTKTHDLVITSASSVLKEMAFSSIGATGMGMGMGIPTTVSVVGRRNHAGSGNFNANSTGNPPGAATMAANMTTMEAIAFARSLNPPMIPPSASRRPGSLLMREYRKQGEDRNSDSSAEGTDGAKGGKSGKGRAKEKENDNEKGTTGKAKSGAKRKDLERSASGLTQRRISTFFSAKPEASTTTAPSAVGEKVTGAAGSSDMDVSGPAPSYDTLKNQDAHNQARPTQRRKLDSTSSSIGDNSYVPSPTASTEKIVSLAMPPLSSASSSTPPASTISTTSPSAVSIPAVDVPRPNPSGQRRTLGTRSTSLHQASGVTNPARPAIVRRPNQNQNQSSASVLSRPFSVPRPKTIPKT